jgi:hypothetical protein
MVFSREHFYLDFEELVLAGFKSRRKSVVNITITSWNKSMDEFESRSSEIEFPLSITSAVKQIYQIADVRLPSAMSKRYATAEVSILVLKSVENISHCHHSTLMASISYSHRIGKIVRHCRREFLLLCRNGEA